MSDQSLDAAAIEQYLGEVAEELPGDGPQRTVILVGGALLAWRGLRDATRDVDSGQRLDAEVAAAVDTGDMEAIWPHCSFEGPEAAADAFYEAYPLEGRDEFLAEHIRQIV